MCVAPSNELTETDLLPLDQHWPKPSSAEPMVTPASTEEPSSLTPTPLMSQPSETSTQASLDSLADDPPCSVLLKEMLGQKVERPVSSLEDSLVRRLFGLGPQSESPDSTEPSSTPTKA